MEFKKRPMFIVITGIIIAVARYLFRYIDDSSKELAILIIMASVNFVALAIVLFFIDSEAQNICKNKINNSGIDTKNKKQRLRKLNVISIVLMILYLTSGIFYMVKFKTTDWNDVISIIALSLSIATNDTAVLLGKAYWKICSFKKDKND